MIRKPSYYPYIKHIYDKTKTSIIIENIKVEVVFIHEFERSLVVQLYDCDINYIEHIKQHLGNMIYPYNCLPQNQN